MITRRTTFAEVRLYAKKSFVCACGRKLRRQKKFFQTFNPWNKDVNGRIKTTDQIYAEVRAEAAAWKIKIDPCTHPVPLREP